MNVEKFMRMVRASVSRFVGDDDGITLEDIDAHIDWLKRRQSSIAEDLQYWQMRRFHMMNPTHNSGEQHGTENR